MHFATQGFRLTHGRGAIPVVGFGTLITDLAETKRATMTALEVGFRHLDCAERYRNEEAVGDALQEALEAGTMRWQDVFVTTSDYSNATGRSGRAEAGHPSLRDAKAATTKAGTAKAATIPRATSQEPSA